MIPLTSLSVPILVSAVLVFVASSLSHAVLPFHRSDYRKLPGEDDVMDLLRRLAVSPADYLFPRPGSRKEMNEPAFKEKYKNGPVGLMTVLPGGGHPMSRTFTLWFLYCAAVSLFAAYLAGRALPAGTNGRDVFLFTGVAAFGGHALALWPASIWYGCAWTATLKSTIDGLVYGILTGAAFAWLWPR